MRELSLHILDIVQNSIAALASLIEIQIDEDLARDQLTIQIADNGKGIHKELLDQVTDPFFTSRKTRRVGLGLALFAQAAEGAEGEFRIDSEVGKGTKVTATFRYHHIDRAPFGDLAGTLLAVIMLNPDLDVVYRHSYRDKTLCLDTREIKRELGEVAINHPTMISWLEGFMQEGIDDLYGGE
ncbi:MAG: sensor histidine kinase [Firmicutes bacterium]|nr:sensor histidine kinase [Bacillota bacterium]